MLQTKTATLATSSGVQIWPSGMLVLGALVGLLDADLAHAGDAPEELIPALGGDRARIDGVDADAVAAVLLGQGHRHGEVRRVGRARAQLDPESGRRAPGGWLVPRS